MDHVLRLDPAADEAEPDVSEVRWDPIFTQHPRDTYNEFRRLAAFLGAADVVDPPVVPPSGGGQDAATFVVAPSDALDTTGADYVLTGTNDHTMLNTVVGALPADGGGIIFLDGEVALGDTWTINKSVRVSGQGYGTLFTTTSDDDMIHTTGGDESSFSYFRMDQNGTDATGIHITDERVSVDHVHFTGFDAQQCIFSNAIHQADHIEGCYFSGGSSGTGIVFQDGRELLVLGCKFNIGTGVIATTSLPSSFVQIVGSQFECVTGVSTNPASTQHWRMVGNTFHACTTGVVLTGTAHLVVGNDFEACTTSITDTSTGSIIAHNLGHEDSFPKGSKGYAQVTADQTGITTLADLTSLTAAYTPAVGRRVRVTGFGSFVTGSAGTAVFEIREGSTTLAQAIATSGGLEEIPITVSVVLTPSAAAHTYKLSASYTGSTMTLDAGSDHPAYILVEDIGT